MVICGASKIGNNCQSPGLLGGLGPNVTQSYPSTKMRSQKRAARGYFAKQGAWHDVGALRNAHVAVRTVQWLHPHGELMVNYRANSCFMKLQ